MPNFPSLASNKIHVELSEPEVRVILALCRMNEFQSLMIESLVGGTDLTDHKATAATLKVEMTRALQRHQVMVQQVAVAEAERAALERRAEGQTAAEVMRFPAAADVDIPETSRVDIPLQR